MPAARPTAPCREARVSAVRQGALASERAARPAVAPARLVSAEPGQREEQGAAARPAPRVTPTQEGGPALGEWPGEPTRGRVMQTVDRSGAASSPRSIVTVRSRRTAGSEFTRPTAAETPAQLP